MLSLLFALGVLFGIAGAMIAAASVVLAVVTAFAWLNTLIAILGARIKERESYHEASKQLTMPHRTRPQRS
jgi:hypothetical protein